jgi:hypothetical protein
VCKEVGAGSFIGKDSTSYEFGELGSMQRQTRVEDQANKLHEEEEIFRERNSVRAV